MKYPPSLSQNIKIRINLPEEFTNTPLIELFKVAYKTIILSAPTLQLLVTI